MLRATLSVFGLALLIALSACGGGDGTCTVGETVACTCANGNAGLRTCRTDGALGACICASVIPDASVTPDASEADSDCVPTCDDWECGDDGCGGSCGTCTGGADCLNGACASCETSVCCDMRFSNPVVGLTGFGGGCTDDRECVFQECLLPGEPGNITNSVFGFCTRGCDCNGDAGQLRPAEMGDYTCLWPEGGKSVRHVVVQCETLADCVKRDTRWRACRTPLSGGATKVCIAQ